MSSKRRCCDPTQRRVPRFGSAQRGGLSSRVVESTLLQIHCLLMRPGLPQSTSRSRASFTRELDSLFYSRDQNREVDGRVEWGSVQCNGQSPEKKENGPFQFNMLCVCVDADSHPTIGSVVEERLRVYCFLSTQ